MLGVIGSDGKHNGAALGKTQTTSEVGSRLLDWRLNQACLRVVGWDGLLLVFDFSCSLVTF